MTIDTDAVRREAEEAIAVAKRHTPGWGFRYWPGDSRSEPEWVIIDGGGKSLGTADTQPMAELFVDAVRRVETLIAACDEIDELTGRVAQLEQLKECADEIDRLNELATDLLDVIFQASVSLYRSDEYPDLPDGELVDAVQSRLTQRFLSGKHEIRPHTFTVTDPKAPISWGDPS